MTKPSSNLDEIGEPTIEPGEALQQPLTAACNYIGAARVLLASSGEGTNDQAARSLANAEIQILRAGDMIRRFQRAMVSQKADK
ncbi:MAG TPA: hypothetical protein VHS33_04130 [Sphingomicrobium sp.]|nr:hypothetical protein [Sphingomicrobium sp.]